MPFIRCGSGGWRQVKYLEDITTGGLCDCFKDAVIFVLVYKGKTKKFCFFIRINEKAKKKKISANQYIFSIR